MPTAKFRKRKAWVITRHNRPIYISLWKPKWRKDEEMYLVADSYWFRGNGLAFERAEIVRAKK